MTDDLTRADLEREIHYMQTQVEQHGFPGTRAVLAELERLRKDNARLREALGREQERVDAFLASKPSVAQGRPGFDWEASVPGDDMAEHKARLQSVIDAQDFAANPVDVTPAPPPTDTA